MCRLKTIHAGSAAQMKKHQKHHGWIFKHCLPLCNISASSIMMERSVFDDLGGFDATLPVCEDYDLWLRMALKYPIGFLDEKTACLMALHLSRTEPTVKQFQEQSVLD